MKDSERMKSSRRTPAGDGRQHESLADFRSTADDKRREMIALEAYYAAERRAFEGDGEVEDWLQAERIVDARLAGEAAAREATAMQEAAAGLGRPAVKGPPDSQRPPVQVDAAVATKPGKRPGRARGAGDTAPTAK